MVPVLERDVRDDEGHVGAVGENGKTAFGTGWRRVLGVFTMTITVGTKHRLLAGEERLLSILRWIELSIPVESRWYLVFRRYVDQIAHRVRFMGGDPTAIGPTSDGDWQHLRPGEHGERGHRADSERRLAFEGKVRSLIYDRYGDFAGFVLDTEDGERRFHSAERPIEQVVWRASGAPYPDNGHRRGRRRAPPREIVLSGLYANDD